MARTARWTLRRYKNGVAEYTLSSWKYFSDFVSQEMLNFTTYVYRGHGDSSWKLEPTLDRLIKEPTSYKRGSHLERFKFETRGRRGASPIKLEDDNDWWALGQHHGLATPLLDWTESPFVALFFAASNASALGSDCFSIHAISQGSIKTINEKIRSDSNIPLVNGRKQTVKIVKPLSDENKRLVSQRGLFTRGPNNVDLETWVEKNSEGAERDIRVMKVVIPNKDAKECLRYLNRMNISHSTLFPDLPGASEFCNLHLNIEKY